jgi:hypothetical protein
VKRRQRHRQQLGKAQEAETRPAWGVAKTSLALACIAFVVYNLNFRNMGTGDSFPARFLPFAVLQSGTLYLDPVVEQVRGGHQNPYWILRTVDGRLGSMYPIVTPLLVTPLYIPVVIALRFTEANGARLSSIGVIMEKLAASVVASFAVGLMFALLMRRVPRLPALLVTLLFAFGTNTWVISSQALWQHGAAELLAILALLALTRPPEWKWLALAGFATGLMVANRPFDVFLAAGLGLFAVFWARTPWRIAGYLACAAIPCFLMVDYNLYMFGKVSGGYGVVLATAPSIFSNPPALGVAGLLVSPARGLLVFAPFFAALTLLAVRRYRDGNWRLLDWALAAGCTAQIIFTAHSDWRAGYSFGPRFLTDMLPLLVWMIAPAVARLRRFGTVCFLVLGLWSTYVQAFGAFIYVGTSEPVINSSWEAPWRWQNAPFVFERHSGLAPRRLLELGEQLRSEE